MRPTCWHQNFGPNGLSAPAQGLCLNVFSSITADFNISSAIRWAIPDQWSSGLLIFLKLCRCFLHGVRMCMWFGYNCSIIFYHFFHFVNLVIFRPQCIDSGYLVSATPHTILYQSFWNFAHVFSMVWRCAYGLDIILAFIFVTFSLCELCHFLTSDSMKMLWQGVPCERNSSYNFMLIFLKLCTCFCHGLEMCIWFGYNPWINFCHFFHLWTLSFMTSDSMKVYRQWLPCKRNSLYNFMPVFMQLCTSFFHGLKMCMWFGFNPAVNFCHFSTLLTLSVFRRCDINFTEVRSIFYIKGWNDHIFYQNWSDMSIEEPLFSQNSFKKPLTS